MARPTLYESKFCELLIEHMAQGLSFESFAGTIGVSRRVLWDWEKQNPDFLHAKEVGLEKSRIFWERLGIDHIINKSDSESFGGGGGNSSSRSLNASVWIFNMKNRFAWRDKQPDEHDVVINNLDQKTDEEIDNRIQELIAKHGTK